MSSIEIETKPPVGWLTLNRPDKMNAFNLEMWKALPTQLAKLEADPDVRVIVIRGAGEKAFGAGADISEFEENRKDPATGEAYSQANEATFRAIRECKIPTIAMIYGFCIGGGCAVALCADIRVAADSAKFAITPARLGLGYSFSGVEHVVHELGPAGARYVFLTAAQLTAAKALELGILQEVVPVDELEARVQSLAETIASNAPLTLRAIKGAVLQSVRAESERELDAVQAAIDACFQSEDYKEGLAAFGAKRKPEFRGK